MASLKSQASKGVIWTAAERFGQQLIQAVIFVILARLLTPEDFGLIAMIMIFFAVSQSFIDSGMGQALIRLKEITDEDRSTVFWFNLLISLLFYGLLYISAPAIARFYEQPDLVELTRVMGLAVSFFGIAIVQRSEMTQQLEFKKQAFAQIPAVMIAGITSVSLAYLGHGVWALAFQYLLLALVSSIILWIQQPAKIHFSFYKESFKNLFGFGYKLFISGMINTVYSHIYKLVIGKYFAAATLGYYTQAVNVKRLASNNFIAVIQKVTYPLLSKTADDPKRMKRGCRQVIQSSTFLIFPGMLLLFIFAEPLMIYVLGEQWQPAAPFLQIIFMHGILYHLHAINLNILKVMGRSDLFLKLEIIKKTNITIAIIIGLQFGIWGLLIGQVISSYVSLFINTYYTARFIDYSITEQVMDVVKVMLLSVPMAVITGIVLFFVPVNSLGLLILFLIGSGLLYLFSNLLFKNKTAVLVFEMMAPYLPKKLNILLQP